MKQGKVESVDTHLLATLINEAAQVFLVIPLSNVWVESASHLCNNIDALVWMRFQEASDSPFAATILIDVSRVEHVNAIGQCSLKSLLCHLLTEWVAPS